MPFRYSEYTFLLDELQTSANVAPVHFCGKCGQQPAEHAHNLCPVKQVKPNVLIDLLHELSPVLGLPDWLEITITCKERAVQAMLESTRESTPFDLVFNVHNHAHDDYLVNHFEAAGGKCVWIPIKDEKAQEVIASCAKPVYDHLCQARSEQLSREQSQNKPVRPLRALFHCQQGVSRSVVCALYCLMQENTALAPLDALMYVRQTRPLACPNTGFMDQLIAWYEQRLLDSSSMTSESSVKSQSSMNDVVLATMPANACSASDSDKPDTDMVIVQD